MSTIVRSGPSVSASARLPMMERVGRAALVGALSRLERGRVTLIEGADRSSTGDASSGEDVTLEVLDPSFYSAAAFGGSIGIAEAYMDGAWTTSDLAGLVEILASNEGALSRVESPLTKIVGRAARIAYALQSNTRRGSKRNITAHYDLSNDFFATFLDPSMTYSCAVFEPKDAMLQEAQTEKIDRACRKLDLRSSDHLIEIGTGWGGAAIHAAREYGCRVTTTTISDRQHEYAEALINESGLADRITLLRRDYRTLVENEIWYDKLISIEMIEAVGRRYLGEYFSTVGRLLKPDGLALIQAITIRDQHFERAARRRDFLKKYIFPGSCLLGVEAMTTKIRKNSQLSVLDLEDIGPHYARTLAQWKSAFFENIETVRSLGFDERFIRMWDFYLSYSGGTFASRRCSAVQMLLSGPDARRAPLTGTSG